MTSLGTVRHFLEYEILKEDECYTLRLTAYMKSLVRKLKMKDSRPVKAPMDSGYTLDNLDSKPFKDPSLYRSLVGALLYLTVNARPDLSLCVASWKEAKRVLQYINTTKDWKLWYGAKDNWKLVGYTDSNWAGDRQTRRSTTGFVFFYGNGAVSWMSKAQGSDLVKAIAERT
nr:uncharacterized protein LOC115266523 [Aedes albopictus]